MSYDLHEKGVPKVNEATCIACGQCVEICPDQVLVLEDRQVRAGRGIFMGCVACGHCVAVCPTDSITVSGRGMTEDDRLELPLAAHRATADQLEALLLSRRSTRRFTDREIDRDTLDRILSMASAAPMGIPPSDVGVVVFHGRPHVQAFAAEACAAFQQAARFFNPVMLGILRPFFGRERHSLMRDFVRPLLQSLTQARSAGHDYVTYNAPAALLFHYDPMGDGADCHIVTTYAMLAAESLGLGTCMIGTTAALAQAKEFKKKYGIPLKNKIGLGLIMGYPAVKFPRGVRRRLASVVFMPKPSGAKDSP